MWGDLPEQSFIEELASPEMREVFRYWLAHRPQAGIPRRQDLNPAELPAAVLPNMVVYRVEPEGRIRIALMGSELVKLVRREETGLYLDETIPEHIREQRMGMVRKIIEDGVPLYYSGKVVFQTREQREIRRLFLPASSDGQHVDHIFGMVEAGPILRDFRDARPENIPDELSVVRYATEQDLSPSIGGGDSLAVPAASPHSPLASRAPT